MQFLLIWIVAKYTSTKKTKKSSLYKVKLINITQYISITRTLSLTLCTQSVLWRNKLVFNGKKS